MIGRRVEQYLRAVDIPSAVAGKKKHSVYDRAFRPIESDADELAAVARANIDFLPIKEAWFPGSMNTWDERATQTEVPGTRRTYQINASLQISFPEFQQLVSHEVVPGHVTTFAYLQNLMFAALRTSRRRC